MRGSQPYLITVARIAGRSLGTDDTLRKFAFERLPHRLVYVARTRHTHRLVDIRPARKRVADGAAQAGGGTAERLYFGRMVVRFVLELKQPLLRLSVHIDVDENAAGVVFLTLLLVVEQSFLLQVTGADGRHVHQADRLAGTPQLFTHAAVEGQRLLHLALHERLVHGNLLQYGRKGGMAAMVAPIGIQYPELRFGRVSSFAAEIGHYLTQVVGIHCQTVGLAVRGECRLAHPGKALQHGYRPHFGVLRQAEHSEVLLARLHAVDIVFADTRQVGIRHAVVEYQQPRTAYFHFGLGLQQHDALLGRRGPLVELPRQVLHSQVSLPRQVARIRHDIRHHFAEHPVTALFKQFRRKAEQVVHVQQTQLSERQTEIAVHDNSPLSCAFLRFHFQNPAATPRTAPANGHRTPRRSSPRR